MIKDKSYKDDTIGVALMRTSFPKEVNNEAITKVMMNKTAIKRASQSVFSKNYGLFQKVGINRDDIESILTANVYVLFSSGYDESDNGLARFLRQRSIKLAAQYRRVALDIPDDTSNEDPTMFIESYSINDGNPESELEAKESAAILIGTVEFELMDKSAKYIEKFFQKNRTAIVRSGYSIEHLLDITRENALQYAAKTQQQSQQISFLEFKKTLIASMSKFIRTIKEYNGH